MTAFSMSCFCATEGINYKNAFNRSTKSGVLHCLGRSPILRGSRSIPPSLLSAVISSSSAIPLLFGIGFTWLIQTVNRLPLQKQKKTEEYTVKLPGWIQGSLSDRHTVRMSLSLNEKKCPHYTGHVRERTNGVRREGGAAKVWGHWLCLQHPASPCPPSLALTQFAYGCEVQSVSLSRWHRMANVDTILFWGVSSLFPWLRVSLYQIPL